MRFVIAVLVLASCAAAEAATLQAETRGAGTPAGSACALLTKDLLAAHTPASKESFNLMMTVKPQEDQLGAKGSACTYGDVTMQIDPFPAANLERTVQKDWTPVTGVGDAAYFRDNRGNYAELIVRSGGHLVTVQMSIPTGRTAASIQSNVIGLTKAILAKLK
jgi:hypothetical protein